MEQPKVCLLVNLLDSQAVARALAERNKISIHEGVVIAKPALRNELIRFRENGRVGMHQVRAHSNRGLFLLVQKFCESLPSWMLDTHVFGDGPLFVLECDVWGAERKAAQDSKAHTVLCQESAYQLESDRAVVGLDKMEIATGGLL